MKFSVAALIAAALLFSVLSLPREVSAVSTGTVQTIEAPGTSGTVKDDSDDTVIPFVDSELPSKFIFEFDRVTFDITGTGEATNLQPLTDIDGPVAGDLKVEAGEFVLLTTTVTGDVKVDGGTLIIRDNSTVVSGDVKGKNGATIQIENANVSGSVKVKNSPSVTVTGSSIGADIKLRDNGDVTVTNNTIGNDLKIEGTTGSCTSSDNTVGATTVPCP